MAEKINQPQVSEKDWQDVRATMEREKAILGRAREMGEDADQISLGYLFVEAIPDDYNAFAAAELADYDLNFVPAARAKILFRLDWEKDHPQMPENFKKRLTWMRGLLTSADWESEEGFREASEVWQKGIKQYLDEYIESNPQVLAATTAFRKFEEKLLRGGQETAKL